MHQNENGWQGESAPGCHMTGHTVLTQEHLYGFRSYLIQSEKRKATVQKYVRDEERELSRAEYEKLVEAVRRDGKERIALIMETIGCTGIIPV